jgi:hypothetical protein
MHEGIRLICKKIIIKLKNKVHGRILGQRIVKETYIFSHVHVNLTCWDVCQFIISKIIFTVSVLHRHYSFPCN